MTRPEAVALAAWISTHHGRDYKAVEDWNAPGDYVVVVTRRASNTQERVDDPHWGPSKEQVSA